MSVFEPSCIQALCAAAVAPDSKKQRTLFLKNWNNSVEKRWETWQRSRKNQSLYLPQLEWEAQVCEYVSFIWKHTRPPKSAPADTPPIPLDSKIPLLGPRFLPPSYMHLQLRSTTPEITPETTYLKALNVVHPFYYRGLSICPRCDSNDVRWNGWSGTGHREVHGISKEETAIGYQLQCKSCEEKYSQHSEQRGEGMFSFLTTSHHFWERREHWEMPPGVPHFFKRCAISSDLFNLIIELRPSSTAAGLAENIRQLHLLEYHKERLAYLQAYHARMRVRMSLIPHKAGLRNFSAPLTPGKHLAGYDNSSITDDLITDLFNKYCEKTRQQESEESLRVKGAVAISLDATFRTASKATIVDSNHGRSKTYKGGIESVLNEKNLIISWRFCHTQGNSEVEDILQGLKRRFDILGFAPPEIATVDNCCHVKAAIKSIFPNIAVCLDVWHFMMRYMICIIGGMKNPVRSAVARSIVDAILKAPANKGTPAVYWSKQEQERRLVEVYERWVAKGGVWSAAAEKTHAEQLSHVKKGCLARPRDDVRSDGSRIESSHKGWNGLQRSFASGLESLTGLCHDFVLRRNIRIEYAMGADASAFTRSTHGSHHVRLVNAAANFWNSILDEMQASGAALPADIVALPELVPPNSGERFGMAAMGLATAAHHALVVLKEEPCDTDDFDLSSQDLLNPQQILSDMGVDPALVYQPLPQAEQAARSSTAATVSNTASLATTSTQAPSARLLLNDTPSQAVDSDAVVAGSTTRPGAVGSTPGPSPDTSAQSTPSRLAATLGTPQPASLGPASEIIDVDALGEDTPSVSSSSRGEQREKVVKLETTAEMQAAAIEGPGRKRQMSEGPDSRVLESPAIAPGSSANRSDAAVAMSPGHDVQQSPKKKVRLMVPGMPKPPGGRQSFGAAQARLNTVSATPSTASSAKPAAAPPVLQLGAASSSGASTSAAPNRRLDQFFAGPAQNKLTPAHSSLPAPTISGTTRSQRLFSVATGIDPRTLSFPRSGDSDSFYLFMRLRKEYQWASYRMTPFDWVCAASLYNSELQKINRERGKSLVPKTPRALMEKLGEIEPLILGRIAADNYASRANPESTFWREHCHAVPLGNKTRGGGEKKQSSRKNHTCARCKTIKYPGPKGSEINHKLLHCADGVWQTARKAKKLVGEHVADILEEPPMYPQPAGVFTAGTHFHPARFISAVQELYERVVVADTPSGATAMQDLAFSSLLQERIEVIPATVEQPSMVLFKLYSGLKLGNCPPQILVEHSGEKYLRVDYLSDPPAMPEAADAVTLAASSSSAPV